MPNADLYAPLVLTSITFHFQVSASNLNHESYSRELNESWALGLVFISVLCSYKNPNTDKTALSPVQ